VTVYLVGAGPGDPGLITARGLELVRAAEVLVYDRLAGRRLVAEAPPGCLLLDAGKAPGRQAMTQEETNAALVEHGRTGRLVVRLKGGDPFVFGRGSEEAEALRAAGVAFEVVPGITSAIAVPAYAGIPVTHRGLSTRFTVVTGHEDPTKGGSDVDWGALARAGGTLVILMGVGRLAEIAAELVAGGRDPATPVAVIRDGTLSTQATVTGTLATIAEVAAGVRPPAVTVVGEVVELREQIAWAERRPLHGVSVAVTRARAQARGLADRLAALGAWVLEAPLIRIEPLRGPDIDPSAYDVVCLTSPNSPRLLLARLGGDARRLAGVEVAAIGPGTAGALREVGIVADVVAERFVAEGLLDALAARTEGRRFLVARAEDARDALPDGLRAAGAAAVDVVPLYRTRFERPAGVDAVAADLVTFTSSSTVRAFATAYANANLATVRGVSIGPVTTATMRELGVGVVAQAERHDLDGLVAAVLAAAAR
jgi:uroporphyrinogen III methyltransferase/synthase